MSLRRLPRPEAASWLSVGESSVVDQEPLITMALEILNLTVETPARNHDLEKAVRAVAAKAVKALELFNAEELRAESEAVSSFTALVNALCRLSERTLKHQQYQDSRERTMRVGKKPKKGLPTDLIDQMHEQLNLL